jgi:hypothetical protein
MYPHERSLVKQLAGLPFAIVGVNSDSDVEQLKETIKEENISWRSFQDDAGVDGKISEIWGIRGWPSIFILDKDGVIRWKGHGGDIDAEISKLLKELGHEVSISHEDEDADDESDDDDDDDTDGEDEDEDDDKSDEDGVE